MEDTIGFDKLSIALTSLSALSHFLNSTKTKKINWQWIYITLHSAVQGYMVLALTGTNSVLTYRDKCAKDWLIKFNACEPLPPCKLNTFSNL